MFPVKQRAGRIAVSLASVPPMVNNDSVSGPSGVSDAIFVASAACGSVANKIDTLERIELPMHLRVHFVIRVADAHCV